MKTPEHDFLSPDKPKTDPQDDRLGYAPFAKHLADSIRKMAPPEGLVIAIYGTWGSGKSSVLGFITHYLENHNVEEEIPIIVRFNPWWFSGQEALTIHFFSQLSATLSTKLQTMKDELVKRIGNLGEIVSKTPVPGAELGELVRKWSEPDYDIVEQKNKIAILLGSQKRRILIVIDDIDRLTVDEIKQVFMLIKAVVDFPNVIYLLAFDKLVVASALEGVQGKGEDYLEKIVQVPFELPIPHKILLRQWLEHSLTEVFGTDIKSDKRWNNVFTSGLAQFIRTPRDIVRLTNALRVTYTVLKDEVNVVDFLVIESLRLFYPTVYYVIRDYREKFVGAYDHFFLTELYDRDLDEFHSSWMKRLPQAQRKAIIDLVADIFPNLARTWNSVIGNTSYSQPSSYSASVWHKDKRICVSFNFDLYFLRLSELKKRIPATEMKALLALAFDDTEKFRNELENATTVHLPDGSSRFSAIVYQMHDYIEDEVSVDHASAFIQVFFDDGDKLLLQESRDAVIWGFGSLTEIFRRITQLLQLFDEPTRHEILRRAVLKGQALSVIGDTIIVLGQQHGKYDAEGPDFESNQYLTLEHFEDLEEIYLKKIRVAASTDSLLNAADPILVLTVWRHLADAEERKEWLTQALEDNNKLLSFLEYFLTYRVSSDGKEFRFNLKSFGDYVDPENYYERIKVLKGQMNLSETQALALECFLTAYESSQMNNDVTR